MAEQQLSDAALAATYVHVSAAMKFTENGFGSSTGDVVVATKKSVGQENRHAAEAQPGPSSRYSDFLDWHLELDGGPAAVGGGKHTSGHTVRKLQISLEVLARVAAIATTISLGFAVRIVAASDPLSHGRLELAFAAGITSTVLCIALNVSRLVANKALKPHQVPDMAWAALSYATCLSHAVCAALWLASTACVITYFIDKSRISAASGLLASTALASELHDEHKYTAFAVATITLAALSMVTYTLLTAVSARQIWRAGAVAAYKWG